MYSSTTIDTKRVFSSFLLSLITLGLLVLSGEAGAAEKNPINEMQSGSLLIKVMPGGEYIQAPLVNTEVELEVSGIVSRAKVIQHFKNDSSDWVQGTYVFPLPDNSAVDKLRMRIGERVIEGQIKERQQAKKEFEKAAKEGKQASLIEQQRPNIFTSKVTNIAPGQTIIVEIEYQNTLIYRDGQVGLRFPLVVAPRYIPGFKVLKEGGEPGPIESHIVPDAAEISPPVIADGEAKRNPVSIQLKIDAGFPIKDLRSTNHAITKKKVSNSVYQVSLLEDSVPADRDFEVSWTAANGTMPSTSIFTEAKADKHYALITMFPPKGVHQVKGRMPRDVVFVVDTSGSMDGASLDQAKNALELAVRRLKPVDGFNIIQFNSETSSLFGSEQKATNANLKVACNYINKLVATGGTQVAPALTQALANNATPGRLRQIVFITDVSVGNEDQLFSMIKTRLRNNRLFTIGIGSSPNDFFMTRAAELGRGTFTFIGSIADVGSKMNDFFARIENPFATDIRIKWPNGMKVDSAPNVIPDLYLGDPVVVAVKTDKPLKGNIEISGVVDGKRWKRSMELKSNDSTKGVGQLWARRKIGELMNLRYSGHSDDDVRASVLPLALEHSLVTKYTSLLAVDVTPVRVKERLKKQMVPSNMPKGWKQNSVFGELPQGATSSVMSLYIAFALTLLAALIGFSPRLNRLWRRG